MCVCVPLTNGLKIVALLIFFFYYFHFIFIFYLSFFLCWPKVFLRRNNKLCNICCVSSLQWYSRFWSEYKYFSSWNSDDIFSYESNPFQILAAEVLGLRDQKENVLLNVMYLKKFTCQWGRSSWLMTVDMSASWRATVCLWTLAHQTRQASGSANWVLLTTPNIVKIKKYEKVLFSGPLR